MSEYYSKRPNPENLENMDLQNMREEGAISWDFLPDTDTSGMSLKGRGQLRHQSKRGELDTHPELRYAKSSSSIGNYSLAEIGRGIKRADDDSFYKYEVVDY